MPVVDLLHASTVPESPAGRESVIVDCALAQEFFLPVKTGKSFSVDPYIPLVSALARTQEDEISCVQVLFQRVMNPWEQSILNAVQGDGSGLFDDAPTFVPFAKEKTEAPLFAVVLRVATQADTEERAWALARMLQGYLLQFNRPGSNEFTPLANDDYPDPLHEDALLARVSYRSGMLLSLHELVGLAHFPDASVTHPALVRLKHRTKAAPHEALGHQLTLGWNEHRGAATRVTLATESRMACEISVTTTAEQEVANLLKCLQTGFDHIIFVCKDKRKRTKVEATLKKELPDVKDIIFIGPDNILAALDQINPQPEITEGTIRGYKVRIKRSTLSAEEIAAKRKAIAEAIARSLANGSPWKPHISLRWRKSGTAWSG